MSQVTRWPGNLILSPSAPSPPPQHIPTSPQSLWRCLGPPMLSPHSTAQLTQRQFASVEPTGEQGRQGVPRQLGAASPDRTPTSGQEGPRGARCSLHSQQWRSGPRAGGPAGLTRETCPSARRLRREGHGCALVPWVTAHGPAAEPCTCPAGRMVYMRRRLRSSEPAELVGWVRPRGRGH